MTTKAEHREDERERRISLYPLTLKEAVSALLHTKPSRNGGEVEGEAAKKTRKRDSVEEGTGGTTEG